MIPRLPIETAQNRPRRPKIGRNWNRLIRVKSIFIGLWQTRAMDQREVACTFFGQKSADTDALPYPWAHTMARVATATAQNGQKSKCFTIQCWLAILTGLQVWGGCVCNFLGKISWSWFLLTQLWLLTQCNTYNILVLSWIYLPTMTTVLYECTICYYTF